MLGTRPPPAKDQLEASNPNPNPNSRLTPNPNPNPNPTPNPNPNPNQARKALHDRVVLDHTPPPPAAASAPLRSFLAALLIKDKARRLGTAADAPQVE